MSSYQVAEEPKAVSGDPIVEEEATTHKEADIATK